MAPAPGARPGGPGRWPPVSGPSGACSGCVRTAAGAPPHRGGAQGMNEISHKPAHAVQNLQGPVSAREHGRTWPTIVGPAVEGEAGHVECGFPAEAGGPTSLDRWRRGLGWGFGNGGESLKHLLRGPPRRESFDHRKRMRLRGTVARRNGEKGGDWGGRGHGEW